MQKLGQSWDKVRKNKPASGVDHVTYEDFEKNRREELKQLHLELAEHRYESLPVKLCKIFKEDKVRTIALFSMRDKIVQQSVVQELGKIYESLFSKSTFAYRPGQSAFSALKLVEAKIAEQKQLWVLQMDIADFFDCIQHKILLRILEKHIKEVDVLELIRTILKAKVLDEKTGELSEKGKGIYQGSSCSPLLSNIYLMDYDSAMELKSSFYIRYSDDILVLESSEEKIREVYDYSRLYLEQKGLMLKDSKTKVHFLDENTGFIYLGYRFTSKGRSIPEKAVASITARLETMWLTSGIGIGNKIKKGQEILGGWEQYYNSNREPDSVIEYVIALSMVQNKPEELRVSMEQKRFQLINIYKDIAVYMADYWKRRNNLQNALMEYEQFLQVPEQEKNRIKEKKNISNNLMLQLIESYEKFMIHESEEGYIEIMQLYTDMGEYRKASYFWESKTKFLRKHREETFLEIAEKVKETAAVQSTSEYRDNFSDTDIQSYMELFVGREDTYAKEMTIDGKQRLSEQVLEPVTEETIRKHLAGEVTLETYIQRPNGTAKYLVIDIDISKKILLQYSYGSKEFNVFKQKAAERAAEICKVLKRMGIKGYIEDTGFRGYHIWIFFIEWFPVRYLAGFTECIQKELVEQDSDITMEFFPNGTRIRQGKMGQKIKLPLGFHVRTGNRSILLDEQFCIVDDYGKLFSEVSKYSLGVIRKILGMYAMEPKNQSEIKEVDRNLERFGELAEPVRIVLEKCSLMRYLCQKAASTGYLPHFERMSVLYVFAHMGDEGKEFVHMVMGFTLNYQYSVTQKFISKLPEKPISCIKLREQYKLLTAEYGCSCNFKRTKNCYPSPVLHAIKNSGEEQSGITVPVSRSISKAKEEKVYEEINIHKQTEKIAQRIVELKKQKRGLDKSIRKNEVELQKIFDNAGIDCLEIEMGMLVRRKCGKEYEWLIEL